MFERHITADPWVVDVFQGLLIQGLEDCSLYTTNALSNHRYNIFEVVSRRDHPRPLGLEGLHLIPISLP